MRRLNLGRLQVYLEPRDLWVGCYVATDAVYVCPLPLVVLRWGRGMKLAADGRPAAMLRQIEFDLLDGELCCTYVDHGSGPCACPDGKHAADPSHPFARTPEDDERLDAQLKAVAEGERHAHERLQGRRFGGTT